MGRAAAEYAKSKQKPGKPSGPPKRSPQEQLALKKLRKEAKQNGVTLKSNGEGGLAPSLALGVFRKGKWRCSNENCPTPKKDLDLDHISGHGKEIASDPVARKRRELRKGVKLGHVNMIDALHILCSACHDRVHSREREIDDGERPEPMRGT